MDAPDPFPTCTSAGEPVRRPHPADAIAPVLRGAFAPAQLVPEDMLSALDAIDRRATRLH